MVEGKEDKLPGTMHDTQELNNYFLKKQNNKLMKVCKTMLPGL